MKQVLINIGIDDGGKMGIAINTKGYERGKMSSELELLGLFQNLVNMQSEKIKTLGRKELKGGY